MRRLLILALLLAGCSGPPEVAVTPVARVDLVDSFRELAETRLSKVYPVTMPISARMGRIDLEPGDPVRSGQVLVKLDRVGVHSEQAQRQADVGEARAELRVAADAEAEHREVERAEALFRESERQLPEAEAHLQAERENALQAQLEARRVEALVAQGALPSQDAEQARLRATTLALAVKEAEARCDAARAQAGAFSSGLEATQARLRRRRKEEAVAAERLTRAQAALVSSSHEAVQAVVVSPINGVVLERHLQGPSHLAAGETLLTLGRLENMEVVAEVLTQEALRVRPGMKVLLRAGPQAAPFEGLVRRIEPAGFTKLSSLGVEQKRVRVIVRPVSGPPLGAGYRLEAEFLIARKKRALAVERPSLLQHPDGSFYVLVVRGGKLREQAVRVGVMEDLRVEVLEGLSEGEMVVAAPDSKLKEGAEVSPLL